MRIAGVLIALSLAAMAGCQTAPPPPSGAQSAEVGRLFADRSTPAIVDGRVFLPPAPQADDPLDRADQAIARGPWTAARIAQAQRDNQIDPFAAFSAVLGDDFRAERLPATQSLLVRVTREAGIASDAPKRLYNRPRPYVRNPSQATCITPDERLGPHFSYPSGHSAIGWAWGLTLAEIDPAHADAILQRAYDFGESRVVCGVHFRSDVESGRLLGAATYARLHADPAFVQLVQAAHAELNAR